MSGIRMRQQFQQPSHPSDLQGSSAGVVPSVVVQKAENLSKSKKPVRKLKHF